MGKKSLFPKKKAKSTRRTERWKIGDSRRFGSKIFYLYSAHFTKKRAKHEAQEVRNKLHYNARTTKVASGYLVWQSMRKKKQHRDRRGR